MRWVVPYPAGGPTDLVARVMSQKLAESWGQNIVLDFRGGANSVIGTQIVATAPADGYTALVALPAFAINPSMYAKLPYDAMTDFAPVSQLAAAPYVLLVNPTLPVNTVLDLIEFARSRPGTLSFGSGGTGSPAHLAMELLKQQAGMNIVHVPYKGGAPALVDLMGGQVQTMVNPALSSLPLFRAGKVRIIAVTSLTRSPTLPQIPTVNESGVPGFRFTTWYGLFLPAKTPRPIVALAASAIKAALQDAGVRKHLMEADADPLGTDPDTFRQFVTEELQRWRTVVHSAGLAPTLR